MNNKPLVWTIVAVVVVVAIVGAVIWKVGLPGVTTNAPGATSTNTANTTNGGSYGAPTTGGSAQAPMQPVISITSPAAGAVWTIGTQNSIAWTEAPNVTGYVYLINAVTDNLAGVIIPQIGPQQTSYTWDTRHLGSSRTNPSQKDVVPGTYYVSMAFDGNHLPVISSPVFTIVN